MSKDSSKMDEISSTERLLEVIRGNSSASRSPALPATSRSMLPGSLADGGL